MKCEVIFTGADLKERVVGHTAVSARTDLNQRMTEIAMKYWKGFPFHVRKDDYLFRFIAVNRDGDTLHLGMVFGGAR